MKTVDVVVLGGGPAGCATALALRRHGCSVLVVERSDYQTQRVGETLPPVVREVLADLGVWDRFVDDGHSPSFGTRSAWGRADLYDNDFIFNPYGPGWHVDRARFDAMLALAAEEAGVQVYRHTQVISCKEGTSADWEIELARADRRPAFRTKLVVDATGRASSVARKMGARRICHDRLVGAVSFFRRRTRAALRDGWTLLEAVDVGWWYSAVLPDYRLIVAFMTDADLYGRANRRSADFWHKQLKRTVHTQSRVTDYSLDTGPTVVAAHSSRLDRIAARNWLAVGDAATTFDPLSSQGVTTALETGLRAARCIGDHFAGNDTAFQRYAVTIGEEFDEYRRMQAAYYAQEERWPHSAFWRRRQAPYNARGPAARVLTRRGLVGSRH